MYRPVKHDKAFSRQMHLSIFSKKLHHRYLTGFQKSFCEVEIFRPNSSIIYQLLVFMVKLRHIHVI